MLEKKVATSVTMPMAITKTPTPPNPKTILRTDFADAAASTDRFSAPNARS